MLQVVDVVAKASRTILAGRTVFGLEEQVGRDIVRDFWLSDGKYKVKATMSKEAAQHLPRSERTEWGEARRGGARSEAAAARLPRRVLGRVRACEHRELRVHRVEVRGRSGGGRVDTFRDPGLQEKPFRS